MSEPTGQSKPDGSSSGVRSQRRWLWPALLASFALNLLIIGMVAGFMLRPHPQKQGFRGAHLLGFVRNLPEDRRNATFQAVRQERRALRELRRSARRARRQAAEVFSKTPYDAAAYAAALEKSLRARSSLRQAVNALSVKIGALLSASERAQYSDWHRRRIRNRRQFRHQMRNRLGVEGEGGKRRP